ncbi:peptide chain release factor N(5)-glutamine methyltransferase [Candidatus Fermentibacteria bacterium]|nr:peptide chain release factor N(5)-glutamine methyltransferase [Candidatus Fermentibacteria bacterium]
MTWLDAVETVAGVLGESLPGQHARAEAWRFTTRLAGMSSFFLPAGAADRIPPPLSRSMALAIHRLASGEPEAYVLGKVPFHEVEVEVNPGTLIPRPETEVLVNTAIESCKDAGLAEPYILELGTGSGCISLALAHAIPQARITATDIWPPALDTAARNLSSVMRAGRVRLVRADWLAWTSAQWDLIVSNPPYIAATAIPGLPPSVREWEPHVALDGGPDGFSHLGEIIAHAPRHLNPQGFLILEISPEQAGRAVECALTHGFQSAEIVEDYAGRSRVMRGAMAGCEQ